MEAGQTKMHSNFYNKSNLLKQLHWLPIEWRIRFKLACLVHKILNTGHPPYLNELIQYHKPSRSTRSSASHLLSVPRHNLSFGARAFHVFAPKMWNSIPLHIRQSQTYSSFRLVLSDTRDTSILIVDTYVTIPVSPRSRYTAVYRSIKKYRETAQVSRLSTIPHGSCHWALDNEQPASVLCQNERNEVTHSKALRKQQLLSHQVLLHCPSLGSIALLSRKDWLLENKDKNQDSNFKHFVDLKCKSM